MELSISSIFSIRFLDAAVPSDSLPRMLRINNRNSTYEDHGWAELNRRFVERKTRSSRCEPRAHRRTGQPLATTPKQ